MDTIRTLKILSKWSMNQVIGKKRPLVAVIGITHYCNYYCPMCPFGDPNKEEQMQYAKEHDLTTEEWKKAFDKVADNCIWAIIEGGEPLSRKDIFELLEYLNNKKIPVTLITNGSLLHTIDLARLKSLISTICCSIDSIKKESYCKVRGVNEELYYRVMNNLKKLDEYDISRYINSVITKWNTEEFITQEYFDYIKNELNIHAVSMTFVQNRVGGPNLLPDRKSMEKVCESILDYSKHHSDPYIMIPRLYFEQILEHGRALFDECGVWKSMVVNADGTVSPCWKFDTPEYKLSLLEYDVDKIWSMPYWDEVKKCNECQVLGCVWYSSQKTDVIVESYIRGVISRLLSRY
ncbi:MAG: radical SAM protein [Candidatus Nitrosothermus koennekii]|nr:MAG: radical SAM protein [Candidatus Nitrosothermus koennekii]